jgi:hypothetical protein
MDRIDYGKEYLIQELKGSNRVLLTGDGEVITPEELEKIEFNAIANLHGQ